MFYWVSEPVLPGNVVKEVLILAFPSRSGKIPNLAPNDLGLLDFSFVFGRHGKLPASFATFTSEKGEIWPR